MTSGQMFPKEEQKGVFIWFLCFYGISSFVGKAILVKEQLWYYLNYIWRDKGVHAFTKGISPKVNVICATGVWTHLLWGHSPTSVTWTHPEVCMCMCVGVSKNVKNIWKK